MAIILTIPFIYRAKVLLPRRRIASNVIVVGESIPVKIESIEAKQAPLIAKAVIPINAFEKKNPKEYEYRKHDGQIYRRMNNTWKNGEPIGEAAIQAGINALHKNGNGSSPFLNYMRLRSTSEGVQIEDSIENIGQARQFISSDKDEIVRSIRKTCSSIIVIDGALFCASEGPSWKIDHNKRIVANHFHQQTPYSFRADRFEQAIEMSRFLEINSDTPKEYEIVGSIDVLGGGFRVDDHWISLRSGIEEFIESNHEYVGKWPRNAANAYLELRDSAHLFKGQFSPELFELVENALTTTAGEHNLEGTNDLIFACERMKRYHVVLNKLKAEHANKDGDNVAHKF